MMDAGLTERLGCAPAGWVLGDFSSRSITTLRTLRSSATCCSSPTPPSRNLSIDFVGFNDIGERVLIQPDGKIVVGGQARNNIDGYGVARINP